MQFQVLRTQARHKGASNDMGRSFVAETAQGPVVIFLDATGAIAGDIDISPVTLVDDRWRSVQTGH